MGGWGGGGGFGGGEGGWDFMRGGIYLGVFFWYEWFVF